MEITHDQRVVLKGSAQVMIDHFVWHKPVSQIAKECFATEVYVRRALREGWRADMNRYVVEAYLEEM